MNFDLSIYENELNNSIELYDKNIKELKNKIDKLNLMIQEENHIISQIIEEKNKKTWNMKLNEYNKITLVNKYYVNTNKKNDLKIIMNCITLKYNYGINKNNIDELLEKIKNNISFDIIDIYNHTDKFYEDIYFWKNIFRISIKKLNETDFIILHYDNEVNMRLNKKTKKLKLYNNVDKFGKPNEYKIDKTNLIMILEKIRNFIISDNKSNLNYNKTKSTFNFTKLENYSDESDESDEKNYSDESDDLNSDNYDSVSNYQDLGYYD